MNYNIKTSFTNSINSQDINLKVFTLTLQSSSSQGPQRRKEGLDFVQNLMESAIKQRLIQIENKQNLSQMDKFNSTRELR